jgi:3-isopropylmalate/(R)-2-methylmalate dehydratase small subunit
VLNQTRYSNASILIAGANFGSGSSREHAVWALQENGFEAVIAPSFADIFRNNCIKVGMLPVQLPPETVNTLMRSVETEPSILIVIDVASRTLVAPGVTATFPLDHHTQGRLLGGLDDIDVTLTHEDAVAAYEARRPEWLPRVTA